MNRTYQFNRRVVKKLNTLLSAWFPSCTLTNLLPVIRANSSTRRVLPTPIEPVMRTGRKDTTADAVSRSAEQIEGVRTMLGKVDTSSNEKYYSYFK